MRIINASHEILTPISEGGIKELQFLEKIARKCYKSEDKILSDGSSAKAMIGRLIKSGHEAMLEHMNLSVCFVCDRGVSHELVRHRLASFAQESTRYCNYSQDKFGSELTFIKPCFWLEDSGEYQTWISNCQLAEKYYMGLIAGRATPQEARALLPNSLKTEVVMTANYREWRHFLKLRAAGTTGKPHPQMLEIAIPLLNELKEKIPIVFDDIEALKG